MCWTKRQADKWVTVNDINMVHFMLNTDELCYSHERTFCNFKPEEYNVKLICDELIGNTGNMTVWAGYRIKRCRYNRVRMYIVIIQIFPFIAAQYYLRRQISLK
jgi:hypothetical protein